MKKCLLIEDNKIAQRLPTMILEANGWQVDIASTGENAMLYILSNEYQMIITDISLPDTDGHKLSALIKQEINHFCPPIIGLSARIEPSIEKNSAITIIYSKPFTKEIYNQIIKNYFLQ